MTRSRKKIRRKLIEKGYSVLGLVWDRGGIYGGWKAEITSGGAEYSWWEYLGSNLDSVLHFIDNYLLEGE